MDSEAGIVRYEETTLVAYTKSLVTIIASLLLIGCSAGTWVDWPRVAFAIERDPRCPSVDPRKGLGAGDVDAGELLAGVKIE